MPLIDISVTISPALPTFPGDPSIRIEQIAAPDTPFRLTRLHFGSHTGTHIDAPAHYLKEGATVETLPLATLIGPCRVIDLRDHTQPITPQDLAGVDLHGVRRLLLRTSNSELWSASGFSENFLGLTTAAATYLVEHGIALIGIDYLSIEPFAGSGEVHRILLEAGVVILEGLDLSCVDAGAFELICLPLKLAGSDGAPCRAVLRKL